MQKTIFFTAALLFICTCAQAGKGDKAARKADIIIRHVTVLSMTDSTPKPNQCVCIDDDKIIYIGDDVLPEQLKVAGRVIPANDKYLMPGMAEMHVHLPKQHEMKDFLTLHLMAGVTTVRSMRGKAWHPEYKNLQAYPAPALFLAAPIITRSTVLTEKAADSLVKAYKAARFDCIKVIDIKDTSSFLTLMKCANKYDMPVCGHMLYNISLECLLNNGYSTIEHLDGYVDAYKKGGAYYNKIIALTKKNNIYHCPTLDWYRIFYHQFTVGELEKRYGLHYMPDSVLQDWNKERVRAKQQQSDSLYNDVAARYNKTDAQKLSIIKKMADNDISLLLGADGGDTYEVPGFNLVEEMKAFQQAGISNYKILQYATIAAAKYMKQDKQWGTVQKGKAGNLVLLTANPLIDINAVTAVEGIFLHNNYHTQKELQASLN